MDFAVIIGIVASWICVILCLILEGNKPESFLSLSSFLLVIGGSFGATLVGLKLRDLISLKDIIIGVIKPRKIDFEAAIAEIKDLAVQARRGGVLSLENSIEQQKDELVKTGLQLIIDGADSEFIQKVLETKVSITQTKKKIGEQFFENLGGYAPTLGIIGTVLGLVKVLGHLSEPDKLGEGIAAAFVATLYGIASANLIFLPLAAKLKANASLETIFYEMVQEGILSIHAGDNPIILEEKLNAFIVERLPAKAGKGKEEKAAEGVEGMAGERAT